eukprot:m.61079 g.61079  ORF g.61079 m.61079 type:complete len:488 (-) comp8000_c0_seq2:20-1483(-)
MGTSTQRALVRLCICLLLLCMYLVHMLSSERKPCLVKGTEYKSVPRPVGGLIPTGDELLALWIHHGAARPEGVAKAAQSAQWTLTGANGISGPTSDSTITDARHGLPEDIPHGNLTVLNESFGIVLSTARLARHVWLGDCAPFALALADTMALSDAQGIAPLEFRPNTSAPLPQQVMSVVTAALTATALGRPFRAAVGEAFSSHYVNTTDPLVMADWKTFPEHYDLVRHHRPHILFGTIQELLHTGGNVNNAAVDGDPSTQRQQPILLAHAEKPTPPELIHALAWRLRLGSNFSLAKATMCAIHSLLRPTDAMMNAIEGLLESSVIDKGPVALIGIPIAMNVSSMDMDRALEHALRMSTNTDTQCELEARQRCIAWTFLSEAATGADWYAKMRKKAETALKAATISVRLTNASALPPKPHVCMLPLDSVETPANLNADIFRAWLSIFVALETTTCTSSAQMSVYESHFCNASVRYNLGRAFRNCTTP